MFTRRHFEAVARILREEEERIDWNERSVYAKGDDMPRRNTLDRLIGSFGDLFAESNPRFDRQKFIDAATAPEREEAGS